MTTTEKMRAWQGPALFSYGFRPFFLGAAIWVAMSMALWIAMLVGGQSLPTALDPVSWHAHAFLFGYLSAVIAGFMMTAVPNWTGRMPIVGWPLAGLSALWLLGRVAVMISALLPAWLVAALDLAFPLLLAAAMTREIVAGRNWRNLVTIGLLSLFIVADALFHAQAARGDYAADGSGVRLGLAAAVMLIALIGGRIVPSFTRNWLAKRRSERLPTPPERPFDKFALLALGAALLCWVIWPNSATTALLLILAGVLHLIRLSRWCGRATLPEPLLWVLHLAYGFVPLGALVQGAAVLWPDRLAQAPAQHLWMAGAVGLMTLAVMTRATRGHSGRSLTADRATLALYVCVIGAVLTRVAAGLLPGLAGMLYTASGALWIAGFGGFAAVYGLMLAGPRRTN